MCQVCGRDGCFVGAGEPSRYAKAGLFDSYLSGVSDTEAERIRAKLLPRASGWTTSTRGELIAAQHEGCAVGVGCSARPQRSSPASPRELPDETASVTAEYLRRQHP